MSKHTGRTTLQNIPQLVLSLKSEYKMHQDNKSASDAQSSNDTCGWNMSQQPAGEYPWVGPPPITWAKQVANTHLAQMCFSSKGSIAFFLIHVAPINVKGNYVFVKGKWIP